MKIAYHEGSQFSRISLKKDMKDFREDLVTWLVITILWFLLIIFVPVVSFLWIIFIIINTIRFVFLTFGNTSNVDFHTVDKAIVETYKGIPVQIIPDTNLLVMNYGEVEWRSVKDSTSGSSSSDSLAHEFLALVFEIVFHIFWLVLIKIKPNTDYFEFSLTKANEGDFRFFHIRSNDRTSMMELAKMISSLLQLPLLVFEMHGSLERNLVPLE